MLGKLYTSWVVSNTAFINVAVFELVTCECTLSIGANTDTINVAVFHLVSNEFNMSVGANTGTIQRTCLQPVWFWFSTMKAGPLCWGQCTVWLTPHHHIFFMKWFSWMMIVIKVSNLASSSCYLRIAAIKVSKHSNLHLAFSPCYLWVTVMKVSK